MEANQRRAMSQREGSHVAQGLFLCMPLPGMWSAGKLGLSWLLTTTIRVMILWGTEQDGKILGEAKQNAMACRRGTMRPGVCGGAQGLHDRHQLKRDVLVVLCGIALAKEY